MKFLAIISLGYSIRLTLWSFMDIEAIRIEDRPSIYQAQWQCDAQQIAS